MRITSKYNKIKKHNLHARLKTASHRFALMVDNYSPDDTEAENGPLMVTGKVFVPGYTDATVTIVYPKRKRSTDQSFYYITPTESTEDMSLAYSDDTFYPRFSECEQAVKDLPEVTVSQYFYDKGIIPDDPSTFTALTGIPLESSLVNDINEITGEDANYYTIGADEEHRQIDSLIKNYTDYQDGDKIIPYLDITDRFFNNGTPTRLLNDADVKFVENRILVSPSDFYNSLTIVLRQPSEHEELNTDNISNYDDWVLTITSTFIPEIRNRSLSYSAYTRGSDFRDYVDELFYNMVSIYKGSLYSSLDEWASLVINGVLQLGSKNLLLPDLYNEYLDVCGNGNPWTHKDFTEFTIKTKDLEGFTPVEGLGNGVFHFVWSRGIEDSLSHFSNPTYLNENPNDNQLYLSDLPNDRDNDERVKEQPFLYSTVYFASNKRGREIVFLHLPDTLMSGCLDTAPSWTTLNYLKTQGQQLMNCLQETILSLSQDTDETVPVVVDENTVDGNPTEPTDTSNDLMSRLVALGWEQSSSTTILSPAVEAPGDYDHTSVKLQFTCIDNTWSLSSLIVSCEASGGEVPLPLSDTQLNDGVTSDGIEVILERIVNDGNSELNWNDFGAQSSSGNLLASESSHDNDRGLALYAARLMNRDIYNLSTIDPEFTHGLSFEDDFDDISDMEYIMNDEQRTAEWVYRVLEAFNLPHSFKLSPVKKSQHSEYWSVENAEYTIGFQIADDSTPSLLVHKRMYFDEDDRYLHPGYEYHYAYWSDLFNGTSYADFFNILPGVGVGLKLVYVFSQPLLDDPQIVNNVQRIINDEFQLARDQQEVEEQEQQAQNWLSQVAKCMNQSQVFTQTDDKTWTRSTNPIVINGTDYSQQVVGKINVYASTDREDISILPMLEETEAATDLSKYERSLIPESLLASLSRDAMWVSAEQVNTLIGHNVLSGVTTEEQLSALEENTNDILPWLSNSSAQQVKKVQKALGWMQYCDKILNNEEIPSLDFISQGLHGNILNLLHKNHVDGRTGVNYFLESLGAVSIKEISGTYMLIGAGRGSKCAYDIYKYYAIPVMVDGWDNVYCTLTFTKQNGKPVCQLQDDCLFMRRNGIRGSQYLGVAYEANAHFTTLGDTFNSLVTGAGLPDYNLLHFLQEQLRDGLQASGAASQALEENKEYIDKYAR